MGPQLGTGESFIQRRAGGSHRAPPSALPAGPSVLALRKPPHWPSPLPCGPVGSVWAKSHPISTCRSTRDTAPQPSPPARQAGISGSGHLQDRHTWVYALALHSWVSNGACHSQTASVSPLIRHSLWGGPGQKGKSQEGDMSGGKGSHSQLLPLHPNSPRQGLWIPWGSSREGALPPPLSAHEVQQIFLRAS